MYSHLHTHRYGGRDAAKALRKEMQYGKYAPKPEQGEGEKGENGEQGDKEKNTKEDGETETEGGEKKEGGDDETGATSTTTAGGFTDADREAGRHRPSKRRKLQVCMHACMYVCSN